ncbi:ectonucleotide pyrophosphatase/phosphodiesterase family member 5 [Orussus abietinus]|uniref:ectonucleotide pyrophosphatase/phosphodiesterase family member 5 n=1 Tax=Orussus abietinus TaxID=222816 RepID=UPI000626439C|nr:ectonucleotide pyrophosphatase/phosphodiesterase family member 5 [Orussus abietinus]
MFTLSISLWVTLVFIQVQIAVLISQHPKLLVVSYDGFRYDYLIRNLTPFMDGLKTNGTYADYMKNIFITKTFPNHHSIMTGLYAETHGVVDNSVLDPDSGEMIKYSYKMFHYNEKISPIWTINEMANNGRRSGLMMWPGGHFKYQNIFPTYAQDLNISVSWEQRIDVLISWFTDPISPINFGVLYIEEPDLLGHAVGIHGDLFDKMLIKLDRITEYLHDQLGRHGLTDVNVIHLSDHGMESVTLDRIINITNYINDSDYKIIESPTTVHIYPKNGKEDLIYQKLAVVSNKTRHFNVYKRANIPHEYHYGNNLRVGPIFVVANLGYAFSSLYNFIPDYEKAYNFTVNNKSEFGLHGYDNKIKEMHPIFFASGPAFQSKCKLEPFDSVDLLPLFCEVLNLSCPSVNGTLQHFRKCLKQSADIKSSTVIILAIVICALLILGGLGGVLVPHYISKMKGHQRQSISDPDMERLLEESASSDYVWRQKINYSILPNTNSNGL